jgi:hypothetical protein
MQRKPQTLAVFVGVLIAALSLMATTNASAQSAPITAGAKWQDVPDLGVAGSHTYLYTPSVLFNPAPMLTPVLFVYSNAGYASQDAAWNALSDAGLIARAEADHALVYVLNPVAGGAWSAADVSVYQDALKYIWGGNTTASGKPKLSYYREDYVIGEGAGSTFINQYMTQAPQVNRIAGIATFGGTMPSVPVGSALPAYIVGGSQQAVDYYKTANGVNATSSANHFYNSANEAKQVIVSSATNTAFDKTLLDDAYEQLFRYTCRQALSTAVFNDQASPEDFTLMKRPKLSDLDLTQREITGADTGTTGESRWYEWLPNEVLAGMQTGSTKKYPLVISLHGSGDHEIYEAESNGWINIAGTKKVIVAAPFTSTAASVMKMITAIEAKYPVDLSRIYVTGFSAGANGTWGMANAYPDVLAAVAPMSTPQNPSTASLPQWNDKLDLPMWYSVNSVEYAALDLTQTPPRVKQAPANGLNVMFNLNNIPVPPLNAIPWTTNDYVTYPLYGFPLPEQVTTPTKWGFPITTSTFRNAYGIPLMQLAIGQGMEHTHYMPLGDAAWAFMSKYSRDPVTKELHIATETAVGGTVGGTVPATLALTLGAAAQFGPFTPGLAKEYTATTAATVISSAGDATLTVTDPSSTATGHLVNGAFSLPQPLQGLGVVKTWTAPTSNEAVPVTFKQAIGATDALRTGAYSKTLTFTLSTTTP